MLSLYVRYLVDFFRIYVNLRGRIILNLILDEESIKLYQGNCLEILSSFPNESIDTIITDPPYFLSSGGISCQSGKMVSVDKGGWDKELLYSMEDFYDIFLSESKRILKKDGTIWVSGTMHNIFTLGYLMRKKDFKILNNITWQKTNPPPNLGCRMFTHSTENIIWAKKDEKSKHVFNYKLMKEINGNKQMKDVWTTSTIKKSEKKYGNHPTQKRYDIIERMVLASTNEGDLILDPFIGSGTTAVAALVNNRNVIGIDLEDEYLSIALKRISEVEK